LWEVDFQGGRGRSICRGVWDDLQRSKKRSERRREGEVEARGGERVKFLRNEKLKRGGLGNIEFEGVDREVLGKILNNIIIWDYLFNNVK